MVRETQDILIAKESYGTGSFRFTLYPLYGRHWLVKGLSPQPARSMTGLAFAPEFRLTPSWAIGTTLGYAVLSGYDSADGSSVGSSFRMFLATGATYRPLPAMAIALQAGYQMTSLTVIDSTDLITTRAKAADYVGFTSFRNGDDVGNSNGYLSCTAHGVTSLFRLQYLFITGQTFATGPTIAAEVGVSRCLDSRQLTIVGQGGDANEPFLRSQSVGSTNSSAILAGQARLMRSIWHANVMAAWSFTWR